MKLYYLAVGATFAIIASIGVIVWRADARKTISTERFENGITATFIEKYNVVCFASGAALSCVRLPRPREEAVNKR